MGKRGEAFQNFSYWLSRSLVVEFREKVALANLSTRMTSQIQFEANSTK